MADAENSNFEFGIENFKPYADLQSIELGKITLIYGSNSSGKSSLLQSLLCISQSCERSDCSLLLNGALTVAGTFNSALCEAANSDKISFGYANPKEPEKADLQFFKKFDNDNDEFPERLRRDLYRVSIYALCFRSTKIEFKKSLYPDLLDLDRVLLKFNPETINTSESQSEIAYTKIGGAKDPSLQPDLELIYQCAAIVDSVAEELSHLADNIRIEEKKGDGIQRIDALVHDTDIHLLAYAAMRLGGWLRIGPEYLAPKGFRFATIYVPCINNNTGSSIHQTELSGKIFTLSNHIKDYCQQCEDYWSNINPIELNFALNDNSSLSSIGIDTNMIDRFSKNVEQSSDFQKLLSKIISSIDSIETSPKSIFSAFEAESQRSIEICNRLLFQLDSSSWRILNLKKFKSTEQERHNITMELAANIMNNSINTRDSLKKLLASLQQLQKDSDLVDLGNIEGELVKEILSIVTLTQTMQNLYGDDKSFELFVQEAENLRRQVAGVSSLIQKNVDYCKDANLELVSTNRESLAYIVAAKQFFTQIDSFVRMQRFFSRWNFNENNDISISGPSFIPIFTKIMLVPPTLNLSNIVHLGPNRPSPKRAYTSEEIRTDPCMSELALWHKNSTLDDLTFLEAIFHDELRELNIEGDGLVCKSSNDNDLDFYSVGIIRGGEFTNICDMGFGISQLMPILVASLQRERENIFVQQPETHLHPKLQADVGDLIIKSLDKDITKSKRWIIETHSHVLLLRILRRIRDREKYPKLSANDLKIYFIDKKPGEPSQIRPIKFTEDGELLSRFPRGFFSQESMEL